MIYLIGSLRNPRVPVVAQVLRDHGYNVFDDWFAAGPDADDIWRDYEKQKGSNYKEALHGFAGRHVFDFDLDHLTRCNAAILLAPAGKSAHLELGYVVGAGKPGFIIFEEEPERFDVMHNFATDVFLSLEDCLKGLKRWPTVL